MKLTMSQLDKIYGTEELEVYRVSRLSLWNQRPALMMFLHDHTCPECHEVLKNAPRPVTRRIKVGSGRMELRHDLLSPRGFFLYYRPRGSDSRLIREVRFVHYSCLTAHNIKIAEMIDMGPNWIPQTSRSVLV